MTQPEAIRPENTDNVTTNDSANTLNFNALNLFTEYAPLVSSTLNSAADRFLPSLTIEGLLPSSDSVNFNVVSKEGPGDTTVGNPSSPAGTSPRPGVGERPNVAGLITTARDFARQLRILLQQPSAPGNIDAPPGPGSNPSEPLSPNDDDPKRRPWPIEPPRSGPVDAPRGEGPRDPNAPRVVRPIEIVNPPRNQTNRPDGTIEGGWEDMPDGSRRTVTYRPPMKVEGGERSTPDTELIERPDGSTVFTRLSPEGTRESVRRERFGVVEEFTRQPDGNYAAVITGGGGERVEGIYDANLQPIETRMNHADGSTTITTYDETGSTATQTFPDGTVRNMVYGPNGAFIIGNEERPHADGSHTLSRLAVDGTAVASLTRYPDGRMRTERVLENGGREIQRFSATGERVGNVVIPGGLGDHSVLELSNGDTYVQRRSPSGEITRTVTLDPMGRVLSETSHHQNGNTRERIMYDHNAGTRSVTRYDENGRRISRASNERATILPVWN